MATVFKRRPQSAAFVSPTLLYRSDELKARLGWHDAAWRNAVRRGLRVRRNGRWAYVLGQDVINFICDEGPE